MTIERIAHGGHGVGYVDGMAVFVPRTAPGDRIDVRIVDQRRRYAFGEMVSLHEASPWRVPPPCPLFERCGGCHLQHLPYTRQLDLKADQVRDSLTRIGKLPDVPVFPTLGSPLPFAYRNKVVYHYDAASGALGMVERGSQHILDIPHCLITDPRANAVLERIRDMAAAQPALHDTLKHVQVQVGQHTDEVLVTVIVAAPLTASVQQVLWTGISDVANGLWMHVKTHHGPAVFNGPSTVIAGTEAIHERIGEHHWRVEPQTFMQVNSVQMERLYERARQCAQLRERDVVLDLYSGSGAIALSLAPHCAQVYAVELNRQASLMGMEQARLLGIENCSFRTGKVERILFRYLAEGLRPDVAVLDPPRAGCQPETLHALAKLRVPRIVYISCSPPTLARDLRLLHDSGYRSLSVEPLDMFPQTYHVECIATVVRQVPN
jgi:23S rRNA (uracil1939-C5)-methyltransferase